METWIVLSLFFLFDLFLCCRLPKQFNIRICIHWGRNSQYCSYRRKTLIVLGIPVDQVERTTCLFILLQVSIAQEQYLVIVTMSQNTRRVTWCDRGTYVFKTLMSLYWVCFYSKNSHISYIYDWYTMFSCLVIRISSFEIWRIIQKQPLSFSETLRFVFFDCWSVCCSGIRTSRCW